MLVHEDDLVISASYRQHVRAVLSRKRRLSELTKNGRGQWTIPTSDYIELDTALSSASVSRFMTAYSKHSQYIIDNAKSLALQFDLTVNDSYQKISVSHAGITSKWGIDEFSEFVGIGYESIEQRYKGMFQPTEAGFSQLYWAFATPVPKDSAIISEAYVSARMALMTSQLQSFHYDSKQQEQKFWTATCSLTTSDEPKRQYVALHGLYQLDLAYKLLHDPVAGSLVFNHRNQILSARRVEAADRERVSRQISRENFTKYWSSLKQAIGTAVDKDEVHKSWATVPIQPKGTLSSRTWGIEIETVQAGSTSRPPGWDERGDGSLEPMVDGCDCGCDGCDEGDHCGYDDCESGCAEFVSPILRYSNSDGLRSLCSDLEGLPVNTTPGIHVHVGGDDLSVTDVARLIRAYSVVSPFIVPLTERRVTNYCKDVSTDNLAHWLGAARAMRKQMSSDLATDVLYHQPDDRYRDLNLQSLRQHGTVEFRVMGPVYNYHHLVRWAWFCREMVNVSRLDLPQTMWTAVRSMADVLAILTKYGSESTPDTWLQSADDLSAEYDAESEND